MNAKISKMSSIFKILSNEVRLCIVSNLCLNGKKKVGDLQICTNSSQSFVSQQLSKLKAQNIIDSEKIGNEVYYFMKDKEVCDIIKNIDFTSCEKRGD